MPYSIAPVGVIHSPFKEKFAVPRQAALAPSVRASIWLTGDANQIDAVRGIEQFSHLWLLFLFDRNLDQGWTPTVRPPRLGGNERVGVFASRATFRPNGIGMSLVNLLGVEQQASQVILHIGSCDLVNNTPIIDIKPYIPYSDQAVNAKAGYAPDAPALLNVTFSPQAAQWFSSSVAHQQQKQVIIEVLAQDPRPAYKKGQVDTKEYAVHLFELNVKFTVNAEGVTVTNISLAR